MTMTYEEARDFGIRWEGHRIRFTYPNGAQVSGLATFSWRWSDRPREPWPINEPMLGIDGRYIGGELEGAIRFEVMQANGRYAEVD